MYTVPEAVVVPPFANSMVVETVPISELTGQVPAVASATEHREPTGTERRLPINPSGNRTETFLASSGPATATVAVMSGCAPALVAVAAVVSELACGVTVAVAL